MVKEVFRVSDFLSYVAYYLTFCNEPAHHKSRSRKWSYTARPRKWSKGYLGCQISCTVYHIIIMSETYTLTLCNGPGPAYHRSRPQAIDDALIKLIISNIEREFAICGI